MLKFTGERIIPQTAECEPTFNRKMYQEHIARYAFAAQICGGKTVLDVGCGVGYGSIFLATGGAGKVLALDIAEDAVDHARQYYSAPNLEFRCQSATELAENAMADVVTCFEVIEHVEDQHSVLAAIKKALKADGIAIISTPRPLEKIRSDFHVKELTLPEFRETLGQYFAHVEMFQENNHFVSLVRGAFDGSIDDIIPIEPPPDLDGADYFIAVVSQVPIERAAFKSRLTLNDDSYILTLEHDVGVLHTAEKGWSQQLSFYKARLDEMAGADAAQKLIDKELELDALRTELASTKAAYELTSYRLAAITNSTMWRATGPLRTLGRRLPTPARAAIRGSMRLAFRTLQPAWHAFLQWRSPPLEGTGVSATRAGPPGLKMAPAARFRAPLSECRVLFISGDTGSPGHIYRIENMRRGLRGSVAASETVPAHELWRVISRLADFHIVVFWRVPLQTNTNAGNDIKRILADCAHHGIATFFDIDDLVFDPEICTPRYIDGLRYLQKSEMSSYDAGVRGYRDMMIACKNALLATDKLRTHAEQFGVRGFIVPNGLDNGYESALLKSPPMRDRHGAVIGYTPGTRTHQKDFAVVAAALAKLLDFHPDVTLRILGPLDLKEFPALAARLGTQVVLDPSVGRANVMAFNESIDINIAPLELDNPYVAGKSELKYFEAAVFGVPTVASRVGPYRRCIEDGRNGFTAATEAEWLTALTVLVNDPVRRSEIGLAARASVAEHYAAKSIATKMLEAFDAVRRDMGAPVEVSKTKGDVLTTPAGETWENNENYQGERPLTINWMVPGLIIGGGGHQNILRAAYHLSRFGHRIRLYFTDTELPIAKLSDMVREHFYPLHCPMYVYDGTMQPADIVFGTYWSTVYKALRHRHVCPEVFYFVQDFEPMFFPMGSDYIMAENTYRLGLYHITSGPWCADFLRRQYKADADSFMFPIQSIYRPRERTKKNPNILFFAKPDMPRRCYQLGLEMLKLVNEARPNVEIILFGSAAITRNSLPFPATCKGLLPTLNDLAELYSNADLGIVFSPTNPSLVPYEMLSCGLPVVDMDRPGAQVNYGDRRDIALLADPVPSVMAKQIIALLDNAEERAERSKAGVEFAAGFPDEESMARRIESLIVDRLTADTEAPDMRQEKTGT